jgi:sodium-coupled monocarboxylate transporter 8/12
MMDKPHIGIFDYAVLACILLVSVVIGLFHGFERVVLKYFNIAKTKNNMVDSINAADLELMTEDEANINLESQNHNHRTQVSHYLTANATMGYIPVAFSILATYISTTTLLGTPAEVYQYGIQSFIAAFGYCIPPLIGAYVTLPFLANLKILSVFEYIQLRYKSNSVRSVGMICYSLKNLSACALFILGPSTALSLLVNMDQNVSIAIICVIGTFYTCIGGIKAVIWTDLFQLCIMFASLLFIIGKGLYDLGGVGQLVSINQHGGRLNLFDFDPDPFKRQSFWSLFFGCWIFAMTGYCFDQNMLQRYKASRSPREARQSILLNVPGLLFVMVLSTTCGMVVYAAYHSCDPLFIKEIKSPNQYISYYVLQNLHMIPGMVGLFLGAVFCSSLSSVSSFLNSLSAIVWKDFLLLFKYFQSFDDKTALKMNKLIVLICGLICSCYAYILSFSGNNLLQLTSIMAGIFNSPLTGLFISSLFFSTTNKTGAICGVLIGLALNLWVSMGSFIIGPVYPKLSVSISECTASQTEILVVSLNSTLITFDHLESKLSGFDNIYKLSFYWYATFGAFNTIFFGQVISLLTGGLRNKVDESLLIYDVAKRFKRE